MIVVLLLLALSLAGKEAGADIYRYLDSEGVECFTDAPTTRNAVRIVRETKEPRRAASKKPMQSPSAVASSPSNTEKVAESPSFGEIEAGCRLPVTGRISSTVGLRHDPIDGMVRDHKGVDIATPEGTPVRPVADGVVVFSGYRQGYGNTVIVRHGNGMITLYAHNSINLKGEGEPVDRGSTIAFSGSTGRTTGPHLHFEAWKDGRNMTTAIIQGSAPGSYDDIRRTVQADGTLRFTNLP